MISSVASSAGLAPSAPSLEVERFGGLILPTAIGVERAKKT